MSNTDAQNAQRSSDILIPTFAQEEPEIADVPKPPKHISRSFQALLTLNRVYQMKGSRIYEGTANANKILARRKRNKTAKRSRRRNRQAN